MNTPKDSSYPPSSGGQATEPGVGDGAEDMAGRVRTEGQEQVQHYLDAAADKVDTLAATVRAAAAEMRDDDVAHLSRHVSDMAGSLGRMADGLREKSADEILHDVRRIARENPTLFIAGSIAIGFGLSRFARASAGQAADSERRSFHGARESLMHQKDRAVQGYNNLLRDNPPALGAMDIAIGALLGAALPSTEPENRLMGEASDSLAGEAREAVRTGADKARDVMHDMGEPKDNVRH
ncbi:hypothetical protein [Frateuria soli]|uniref:hypothetical protein n=1 Tax=Frateuria soli TaxID=1542730 RepID=UPI001E5B619A|nr:hypothetical protein [Frateuria soli]UGB36813.1 hypothetical protein LQ771_08130 [Frateuria soli]